MEHKDVFPVVESIIQDLPSSSMNLFVGGTVFLMAGLIPLVGIVMRA